MTLILDNSIDFIVIFLALLQIDAVPVPLKPEYRQLELDEIFNNSRPCAVVVEQHYLGTIRGYLEKLTVISRGTGGFRLEKTASDGSGTPVANEETASLNYTYRGHGYPLGAMIPHGQYLHGARVLQEGLQSSPGESMLSNLPMSHIFALVGCMLVPLLYRMTAVIARTLHPRHLFAMIAEHDVQYMTAVPEIYMLLHRLKDPALKLPMLKAFVCGGSLLTMQQYESLREAFGVEVLHGYGLTEFAPASRNMRGQARAGTVGPLCHGVQGRIYSPDGQGNGEIALKAPCMTREYYRRASETREAFREGWLMTGDLGRFDQGHLVFVRELKNTCKINGTMVDLEEVRRAILLDREVSEAAVAKEGNALTARIGVGSRIDLEQKARALAQQLKRRIFRAKNTEKSTGSIAHTPRSKENRCPTQYRSSLRPSR